MEFGLIGGEGVCGGVNIGAVGDLWFSRGGVGGAGDPLCGLKDGGGVRDRRGPESGRKCEVGCCGGTDRWCTGRYCGSCRDG